ncbi:MAG TPA: alpha/beta hydrolase [Flavobacterium sp.]|jgi:pimeloyl-ACP methyl ester carboxylesterase
MKKTIASLVLLFTITAAMSQSKAFEVDVLGKGQPIILIPGYSCSGSVWDETADYLKGNYELHILTLAGFAGVAPIDGPFLPAVRDQIIQYVKDKHLKKPMLIGHSLGAFMSLYVCSAEPDLFGKVIAVDGVPFISALNDPNTTVELLKDNPRYNMDAAISSFRAIPTEGYIDNMTAAMLYQVNDTVRARQIATWSSKSDRATLGRALIEMSLTDIRKDIATIKSPVLVLASLFGTADQSQRIYSQQYSALPNATIKVANSKHFIMYDVPEWFYAELDLFLKS